MRVNLVVSATETQNCWSERSVPSKAVVVVIVGSILSNIPQRWLSLTLICAHIFLNIFLALIPVISISAYERRSDGSLGPNWRRKQRQLGAQQSKKSQFIYGLAILLTARLPIPSPPPSARLSLTLPLIDPHSRSVPLLLSRRLPNLTFKVGSSAIYLFWFLSILRYSSSLRHTIPASQPQIARCVHSDSRRTVEKNAISVCANCLCVLLKPRIGRKSERNMYFIIQR